MYAKPIYTSILALCVMVFFINCNPKTNNQIKNTTTNNPVSNSNSFINSMIQKLSSEPVKKNKTYIQEFDYKGKKVYYIPANCCDKYSSLYDDLGNLICHPDGGITGKGDGKCPDFNISKAVGKIIWQDNRQSQSGKNDE